MSLMAFHFFDVFLRFGDLPVIAIIPPPSSLLSPIANNSMNDNSINKYCPHSGKPVTSDSLTSYRGLVVGFCNPDCRNDFDKNQNEPKLATVRQYFDTLIQEHELITS